LHGIRNPAFEHSPSFRFLVPNALLQHFVGNRAIELAGGQAELQIAYAGSFTALSFFVPVIVLLAAFVAIGTNNKISWWRVIVGGGLAGSAIAGMHFIGDFSISNYACV